MVYLGDFLLHAFGCVVFVVGAQALSSQGALSFLGANLSAYGSIILAMFVLLFWTSFFYSWTKNYFDVWYVTDRHIIAVNQKDMFEREEAFMELVRIQDVFFEKNGMIATLLGYGELKIQSAGTEPEFRIEDVRDVEAVSHRIMELRDKAQGKIHADTVRI
jgi:hypothetical protein